MIAWEFNYSFVKVGPSNIENKFVGETSQNMVRNT